MTGLRWRDYGDSAFYCGAARYALRMAMARLARVIVPGTPYHVTQRGNGRERTFFSDDDFALYRDLLGEACRDAKVGGLAWCLMPNHVHLILTPSDGDGLRRALARVHRRYAGIVNTRRRRSGHFWQGRFGAVAMDEDHLAAAFGYVSLNPVRARLVARAQDWRWSSARAHLGLGADGLTDIAPAGARFANFADLLEGPADDQAAARLRKAESVGRPVGSAAFIAGLEAITNRRLRPLKRGPRGRDGVEDRDIAGRMLNCPLCLRQWI